MGFWKVAGFCFFGVACVLAAPLVIPSLGVAPGTAGLAGLATGVGAGTAGTAASAAAASGIALVAKEAAKKAAIKVVVVTATGATAAAGANYAYRKGHYKGKKEGTEETAQWYKGKFDNLKKDFSNQKERTKENNEKKKELINRLLDEIRRLEMKEKKIVILIFWLSLMNQVLSNLPGF